MGIIEIEETAPISYYLDYYIDKKDSVRGYSLSNIMDIDETKSEIIGFLDREKKILFLHESSIIYTKSELDPNIFCNLQFEIPFKRKEAKKISFDFQSSYPDGSPCVSGKMQLTNAERIEVFQKKLIAQAEKMAKKGRISSQELKTIKTSSELVSRKRKTRVEKGEKLSFLWNKDFIELSLWDFANNDNDSVSVSLNGAEVFSGLISSQNTLLNIPLKNQNNRIQIKALNEGRIKMNTTSLSISNGVRKEEFLVFLEKNTQIDLLLKKN
jgi:hypothetical protein